jgi:hypothetical protein
MTFTLFRGLIREQAVGQRRALRQLTRGVEAQRIWPAVGPKPGPHRSTNATFSLRNP